MWQRFFYRFHGRNTPVANVNSRPAAFFSEANHHLDGDILKDPALTRLTEPKLEGKARFLKTSNIVTLAKFAKRMPIAIWFLFHFVMLRIGIFFQGFKNFKIIDCCVYSTTRQTKTYHCKTELQKIETNTVESYQMEIFSSKWELSPLSTLK